MCTYEAWPIDFLVFVSFSTLAWPPRPPVITSPPPSLCLQGARKIGRLLGKNKSLTVADLRSNDIGVEGGKKIFKELGRNNQTLTDLDLSGKRKKWGEGGMGCDLGRCVALRLFIDTASSPPFTVHQQAWRASIGTIWAARARRRLRKCSFGTR